MAPTLRSAAATNRIGKPCHRSRPRPDRLLGLLGQRGPGRCRHSLAHSPRPQMRVFRKHVSLMGARNTHHLTLIKRGNSTFWSIELSNLQDQGSDLCQIHTALGSYIYLAWLPENLAAVDRRDGRTTRQECLRPQRGRREAGSPRGSSRTWRPLPQSSVSDQIERSTASPARNPSTRSSNVLVVRAGRDPDLLRALLHLLMPFERQTKRKILE